MHNGSHKGSFSVNPVIFAGELILKFHSTKTELKLLPKLVKRFTRFFLFFFSHILDNFALCFMKHAGLQKGNKEKGRKTLTIIRNFLPFMITIIKLLQVRILTGNNFKQ